MNYLSVTAMVSVLGISFTAAVHYAPPTVAEMSNTVVEIRSSVLNEEGALVEDGTGSGVVVDKSGYVLTCNHVVADTVQVLVEVDGVRSKATVIAQDARLDLALLKVDRQFPAAVTWGDSAKLKLGDTVFAIGFPFDVAKLVRKGIISSIGYSIESRPFVVTDAQINPGDSGGGVFDANGRFIGVSARIQSAQGLRANVGMAYFIPGNVAHWFVTQHMTALRSTPETTE